MAPSNYERGVVAEMYPNRGWKKRVDKMSDGQIHAIYIKEMQRREDLKNTDPKPEDPPHIPF